MLVPAAKELHHLLIKQAFRGDQMVADLWSCMCDTFLLDEAEIAEAARLHGQAYQHQVKEKGRGHNLGPPYIYIFGGMLSEICNREKIAGDDKLKLQSFLEDFGKLAPEQRCEKVSLCRRDKAAKAGTWRYTLVVEKSGIRSELTSALLALGAVQKFGRAPPSNLARELQHWAEAFTRATE